MTPKGARWRDEPGARFPLAVAPGKEVNDRPAQLYTPA